MRPRRAISHAGLWVRRQRAALRRTSSIPVLRADGASIGTNVFIGDGSYIDGGFSWLITIEDDVTLGPGVQIIAHDASTKASLKQAWAAPVCVSAGAYIGARAIVLPGVTIGKRAVVGAGSVVTRDVPADSVAVGAPARVICSVQEMVTRQEQQIKAAKQAGLWGINRADRAGRANQCELRRRIAATGGMYTD
jgi:maltose O-acetyltransferase